QSGASGRNDLWDRREQEFKIRMGALAFSHAREALCPYGLFVSPESARDRASTHRLTQSSFRACAFPALNSAQSSAPRNWSAMRQVKFSLRIHEPLLGMN